MTVSIAAMAGHEKRYDRAGRAAQAALSETGEEIRRARLDHDLSQTIAGRAMIWGWQLESGVLAESGRMHADVGARSGPER